MTVKIILIGLLFVYSCNQHDNRHLKRNDNKDIKMASSKFESSNLTTAQKQILTDFSVRRNLMDKYIKSNKLKIFTCPGCGFPTLEQRGTYEICEICDWEDDDQDDPKADEIWGGPNGELSLTENRLNIGKTFQYFEDSLSGKLVTDPAEIILIIKRSKSHMDSFEEKNDERLMTSKKDDSIWKEWGNERQKILSDLIKKK